MTPYAIAQIAVSMSRCADARGERITTQVECDDPDFVRDLHDQLRDVCDVTQSPVQPQGNPYVGGVARHGTQARRWQVRVIS